MVSRKPQYGSTTEECDLDTKENEDAYLLEDELYEDEQLFEKHEDPETTWGSPDDELYYQEEPWTDDFNPQLEEACATHLVARNYYPAVALQGHAAANCPQNKGSQSPKRAKTETATKNTGQAFMMHDLNQNGEPHVD